VFNRNFPSHRPFITSARLSTGGEKRVRPCDLCFLHCYSLPLYSPVLPISHPYLSHATICGSLCYEFCHPVFPSSAELKFWRCATHPPCPSGLVSLTVRSLSTLYPLIFFKRSLPPLYCRIPPRQHVGGCYSTTTHHSGNSVDRRYTACSALPPDAQLDKLL